MGLGQILNNARVTVASASIGLTGAAFGGNPEVDDARRGLASSSMVERQPAAGDRAATPDSRPRLTTHEMLDRQVMGRDGVAVPVRISAYPLSSLQSEDRDLIGAIPGGPQVRGNTGLALDRRAMEAFNHGRLTAFDVTQPTPRPIGALTQRTPEIAHVLEALKKEGYTGAALLLTHGTERGALVLQTAGNGQMVMFFENPAQRRDQPGTDARDAQRFAAAIPQIIQEMVREGFGLEIGVAPAAAPAGAVPAAARPAPTAQPAQAGAPVTLSASQLEAAVAGRYHDKYGPALRGDRLSRGTLPVDFVRQQERVRLAEYISDLEAVRRGTRDDLKPVEGDIRAGSVSDQSRIVAVRMGYSPEQAANLGIADLPNLRDDIEGLYSQANELKREYTRKRNALR